jgi:hypothetical protein
VYHFYLKHKITELGTGRTVVRNFKGGKNPFYGRKHSDESRGRYRYLIKGRFPGIKVRLEFTLRRHC